MIYEGISQVNPFNMLTLIIDEKYQINQKILVPSFINSTVPSKINSKISNLINLVSNIFEQERLNTVQGSKKKINQSLINNNSNNGIY